MAGYNGGVVGVVVSTFVLTLISVMLRVVARRITHVHLWWDDHFAIVALLFSIAWCAVVMVWTLDSGLGRPFDNIDIDSEVILEESRLYLWISQILYAFSLAFSKLSILALYWRLFHTSDIRIPIQILGACSIAWLVIRILLSVFHCSPTQGYWDHTIEGRKCPIKESNFFFGTVFVHVIIDLCVLALPVVQVRRLKLRVGQKLAVIFLFMFGILVCMAAVVVLVECVKFDPSSLEMPLNVMPIMICATIEINCAIISACLPMMRPIFSYLLPRSGLSTDPTKSSGMRGTTGGHGIRLTTVTRNEGFDEADSTRQFAQDVECGSLDGSDHEHPHNGHHGGPKTIISGPAKHDESDQSLESRIRSSGIHVQNKIRVSYEPA